MQTYQKLYLVFILIEKGNIYIFFENALGSVMYVMLRVLQMELTSQM